MTRRGARIRLALVGAGLVGRRHLDAIAASEEARCVALVDPSPAAREIAQRHGLALVARFSDLDRNGLDAIVLATPNAHHVPGGLEAVAAGLPVLVEKPLAADVESGRRLVEAAEAARVPILVGHHRRHNPLIAAAKARIEEGAIGTPVCIEGLFWLYKPDDYFDVGWRREPGAGPVFINLIHDIDLLRHLVGEIESVQAIESSRTRGHAVEDTAVIALRFANGALGTFAVSDTIPAPWSWETTAGENPAYPCTGETCYRIGGTHGALEIPSLRLWRHEGRRGWWEPLCAVSSPAPIPADPLVRQIAHFARVVRGEEAPLVSGREGLATLAVIEAIKRAARDGVAVDPRA